VDKCVYSVTQMGLFRCDRWPENLFRQILYQKFAEYLPVVLSDWAYNYHWIILAGYISETLDCCFRGLKTCINRLFSILWSAASKSTSLCIVSASTEGLQPAGLSINFSDCFFTFLHDKLLLTSGHFRAPRDTGKGRVSTVNRWIKGLVWVQVVF
jgi:hypothetical protein